MTLFSWVVSFLVLTAIVALVLGVVALVVVPDKKTCQRCERCPPGVPITCDEDRNCKVSGNVIGLHADEEISITTGTTTKTRRENVVVRRTEKDRGVLQLAGKGLTVPLGVTDAGSVQAGKPALLGPNKDRALSTQQKLRLLVDSGSGTWCYARLTDLWAGTCTPGKVDNIPPAVFQLQGYVDHT